MSFDNYQSALRIRTCTLEVPHDYESHLRLPEAKFHSIPFEAQAPPVWDLSHYPEIRFQCEISVYFSLLRNHIYVDYQI